MSTEAKVLIQCQPTTQSWWSQRCPNPTCDHSLLMHRNRDVWVLPDGSELVQPLGEPVQVPEGSQKHTIAECSVCNLKGAVGELYYSIATMSNTMADFAQTMRDAQAKAEDKIDLILEGETPADPPVAP